MASSLHDEGRGFDPLSAHHSVIGSESEVLTFMKTKPIKQPDASACGPAVIKIVTNYFGLDVPMAKIKRIARYDRKEGMTNKEIVKTLKGFGFRVIEKHDTTWKDLQKTNKKENAIIVSWMLHGYIGHVSMVERVSKKTIHLADSVSGRIIQMFKVVFLRLWFDYDDKWYPEKNSDIQLRWLAIVSRPRGFNK